jgi:hypothetical protein
MKITTQQLERALTEYFNQEILSKAGGWRKFSTALLFNIYKTKTHDIIAALAQNPAVSLSGIISPDDHTIDIDILYSAAKDAIHSSGQFELMGIIFTETDIDKIYSIARTQQNLI